MFLWGSLQDKTPCAISSPHGEIFNIDQPMFDGTTTKLIDFDIPFPRLAKVWEKKVQSEMFYRLFYRPMLVDVSKRNIHITRTLDGIQDYADGSPLSHKPDIQPFSHNWTSLDPSQIDGGLNPALMVCISVNVWL